MIWVRGTVYDMHLVTSLLLVLVFILVDLNKLIYCLPSGSNQVLLLSFSLGFSCLVSAIKVAGVTHLGRNKIPGTSGTVQRAEYPCVCVTAKGWKSPGEVQIIL